MIWKGRDEGGYVSKGRSGDNVEEFEEQRSWRNGELFDQARENFNRMELWWFQHWGVRMAGSESARTRPADTQEAIAQVVTVSLVQARS